MFAIAAVIGVVILKNWLTSAKTSRTVIYLHGVFAVLALGLLAYKAFQDPVKGLKTSLILFAVAAVGGLFMFFRDLKGINSPMWLAAVHALLAVGAFVILLINVI